MEATSFSARIPEMMRWHFDKETGSPFWLQRLGSLPFDPLTDVRGIDDLLMFPDVSDDLRHVPVQDLIPNGLRDSTFRVYESGGTSGAPKRVVVGESRQKMLSWAMERLVQQGLPSPAHWLHLGPTGPHVFGFDCSSYASLGGGTFYTVDFDPRWVKKLIAAGQSDIVAQYVGHLLDQMREVLISQPIRVLSTTPPLIEAICARPELLDLVRDKVSAVIWAGTSFSAESLKQVKEFFLPGVAIIGIYGNTLMGVAPQRSSADGSCVFEPYPDAICVELIDDTGSVVEYGDRGRVRMHLLSKEMFLPNVVERDTAIRTKGGMDGLADVQTLTELGTVRLIEGVY